MKTLQSNPPQKEIYRLWYEYLRESPRFMEACQIAIMLEKKIGKKRYAKFWGPSIPGGRPWPGPEMLYGVQAFGNIGALNFDEWWELKQRQLAEFEKRKNVLVEDYSLTAGRDILGIINEFQRMIGRKPDLMEFMSWYKNHLESSDNCFLFLRINLRNIKNMDALKKAVGKMVNQKKKESAIRKNLRWGEKWIYPIGPIYRD